MILELNTDERVFQLTKLGFGSKTVFCNPKHIPNVLTHEFEKHDEIKALHFWNGKFTVASKKLLNEMFESNQIAYNDMIRVSDPEYPDSPECDFLACPNCLTDGHLRDIENCDEI